MQPRGLRGSGLLLDSRGFGGDTGSFTSILILGRSRRLPDLVAQRAHLALQGAQLLRVSPLAERRRQGARYSTSEPGRAGEG